MRHGYDSNSKYERPAYDKQAEIRKELAKDGITGDCP